MCIGQPFSKDVNLASKSCDMFWWHMLQFVSDTQPPSSTTAEAQDYAIGSQMRVFQYILQRLLTSHSTAGLGQLSSAKIICRINPSSSRHQVPQKYMALDYS